MFIFKFLLLPLLFADKETASARQGERKNLLIVAFSTS